MDSANAIGNFPFLGNKIVAPEDLDDIPFNPPTSDLGSVLHTEIRRHNDPLKGVYENRHGITQGATSGNHFLLLNKNLYRTISNDSATPLRLHGRLQIPDYRSAMSVSPERNPKSIPSFAELIIQVSKSLPGTPLGSPVVSPHSTPTTTRKVLVQERSESTLQVQQKVNRAISSDSQANQEIRLVVPSSPPKTPTQESPKKQPIRRIKSEFTNRDLNIWAPTSM